MNGMAKVFANVIVKGEAHEFVMYVDVTEFKNINEAVFPVVRAFVGNKVESVDLPVKVSTEVDHYLVTSFEDVLTDAGIAYTMLKTPIGQKPQAPIPTPATETAINTIEEESSEEDELNDAIENIITYLHKTADQASIDKLLGAKDPINFEKAVAAAFAAAERPVAEKNIVAAAWSKAMDTAKKLSVWSKVRMTAQTILKKLIALGKGVAVFSFDVAISAIKHGSNIIKYTFDETKAFATDTGKAFMRDIYVPVKNA